MNYCLNCPERYLEPDLSLMLESSRMDSKLNMFTCISLKDCMKYELVKDIYDWVTQ